MIRLIARWVDDPRESPLAVDLVIENGRVTGPSLAFGCISYDGPRRPFTLDETGALAFGDGAVWRSNLRGAEMRVGATFQIDWGQGDFGLYRIVKLAELGAKA